MLLSTAAAAASLTTVALYLKRRRAWASSDISQTLHETPFCWRDLPPDLILAIAHVLLPDANCAYEMLVTCHAWHGAIAQAGDTFWRPITFARFPRLRKLVLCQPSPRSFKTLLKQQVAAEHVFKEREAKRMILNHGRGTGTSSCTMRDFAWTFELLDESDGTLLASWTGPIQSSSSAVMLRVEHEEGYSERWTKANDPVQAENGMMSGVAIAIYLTRNLHTRKLGCLTDPGDGTWDDETQTMAIYRFGSLDLADLDELGSRSRYYWSRAPRLQVSCLNTLNGRLDISFRWGEEFYDYDAGQMHYPSMNSDDLKYALPHLLDIMLPRELAMP